MKNMDLTIMHGSGAWFVHQVMSALIHSAVYGVMYHVFKGLGLGGAVLASGVVLGAVWVVNRLVFARR
jgi:hypothetical protein